MTRRVHHTHHSLLQGGKLLFCILVAVFFWIIIISHFHVSNRQIHEDLGVPLFADHIRALTESFDSKLADVGNPLLWQLGRNLSWPRVDLSPDMKAKGGRRQQASQGHSPWWASRQNESRLALNSQAPFGYPDWGFPWFSSVVRQMPGYSMQSMGTARTPLPQVQWLHLIAW